VTKKNPIEINKENNTGSFSTLWKKYSKIICPNFVLAPAEF
jgi:hypothetical protein